MQKQLSEHPVRFHIRRPILIRSRQVGTFTVKPDMLAGKAHEQRGIQNPPRDASPPGTVFSTSRDWLYMPCISIPTGVTF